MNNQARKRFGDISRALDELGSEDLTEYQQELRQDVDIAIAALLVSERVDKQDW